MTEACMRRKLNTRAMAGRTVASLVLALAAGSAPAFAHHSGAMFDQAKVVTLTGAVKEFKWVNPHASIELVTMGPTGGQLVWSIECSTPNILVRHGWSIHSLKPGDMVSLTAHPMRDGGQAGLVMAVTTSSGAVLKDHDY
jgi:hypothetical protein